jgi:phage baseplate assembly protein W
VGLRAQNLVGIDYPFRKEDGEFPKKALNAEAVKSDLLTLMRTPLRSRVMRANFGTIVDRLILDPIDALLVARLERSIRQAIALHEPRVRVQSVEIGSENTTVTVTVRYEIQGFNDEISLGLESL